MSGGGTRSAMIGRMGALSRADVEHVAYLARLGLTDDELTRLEGELNHILDQYAILARLDTDAIPPTAQTIELENILREDVARPSLTVDEALANAPAREGNRIVVPAIIGAEQGSDAEQGSGAEQGSDAQQGSGAEQGSGAKQGSDAQQGSDAEQGSGACPTAT